MFTLPAETLVLMRIDAEKSMQGYVSFYDVTITRDVYGNETYASGLIETVPCYFGGVTGKDEEIVTRLITDGKIKTKVGTCLIPHTTEFSTDYVCVVNNDEWSIVWSNEDTLPEYKVYTKLIVAKLDPQTKYKDTIRRNG